MPSTSTQPGTIQTLSGDTDVPQPAFSAEHLGELGLAELIVMGRSLLYALSSILSSYEKNQKNTSNLK